MDKIKKLFLNRNLLILLLSFVFVAGFVLAMPHSYGVNDNYAILVNAIKGFPLVFMSPVLGKILSFLYLKIGFIPWYGLMIYFVLAISLFLIVKSFLSMTKSRSFFIPFLFLYLSSFIYFLVEADYNSASIMIGTSSLVAFLIYLLKPGKKYLISLGLGFFFALSYLLRMEGLVLILAFNLPILLFYFLRVYPKNKQNKKHLFVFVLPLILVIIASFFVGRFGISVAQRDYLDFNKTRGRIHDLPVSLANMNNQKLLKLNNWTENDYLIFLYFSHINENKFNKETMQNILSSPESIKINYLKLDTIANILIMMKNVVNKNPFYFALLILLSIVIIFKVSSFRDTKEGKMGIIFDFSLLKTLRERRNLILILCLIYFLLILALFLLILHLPNHIFFPLCLSFFVFLFFLFIFFPSRKSETNFNNPIVIVILIIFSLVNVIHFYRFIMPFGNRIKIYRQAIKQIEHQYPDNIILSTPGLGIHFESLSPMVAKPLDLKVIPLGWPIYSPYFYDFIDKNLNIKRAADIIPLFIDNDKDILITHPDLTEIYTTYIKENYQRDVVLVKVGSLPDGDIYRIVSHK